MDVRETRARQTTPNTVDQGQYGTLEGLCSMNSGTNCFCVNTGFDGPEVLGLAIGLHDAGEGGNPVLALQDGVRIGGIPLVQNPSLLQVSCHLKTVSVATISMLMHSHS
jgi:hypothetical protein